MKIGVLTGGGDCPGLNSVIYGVLLKAYDLGHEVVGIEKGWKGFMENIQVPLNISELDDLHTIGGTILYTSRHNPYKEITRIEDAKEKDKVAKSHEVIPYSIFFQKYSIAHKSESFGDIPENSHS